jgi:hypothetical protein
VTITKRVSALASGGHTKRVVAPDGGTTTKRVLSSGATATSGPFIGTDTWSRSWGGAMTSLLSSWGRTWFYGTESGGGAAASPAVSTTIRIGVIPIGGITERVEVDHYLNLEGDESGHLLLGDGTSLGLEGDQARSVGGTTTRRVTL